MKRIVVGLILGLIISMMLGTTAFAAESPDQIVIVPVEHIHFIDFGPIDPGPPEVIVKTPQGELRGNQNNQSNH